MSFNRASSDLAAYVTSPRYSWRSSREVVSSAKAVMPMMAFMGVRISWLMFARNSLFNLSASFARFVACSAISSASRSSRLLALSFEVCGGR